MNGRRVFYFKIGLSLFIATVLSLFVIRYVSFEDRPELNRSKLISEFADARDLGEKTITALTSIPRLLMEDSRAAQPVTLGVSTSKSQ